MADKNMEAQISVEFEEATSRQSLNSGETINTLWGKVKRWLSDLKVVCFSGSYNDLSDTPTTATKDTDGLMSAEDKSKLDNADDTYALKSKYGDTTINVGRKAGTTVGAYSTAEGYQTTASGNYSHAEGFNTTASGFYSHAGGSNTKALKEAEFAHGKYNQSNDNTLFSIGDGTADDARHNAFEITTTGGKLHDKDIATMENISNPNLLINPDFRINQRESTEYSPARYTADRWFNDSYTKVTVESDGITITAVQDINQEWWGVRQYIESVGQQYSNLPITVSAYISEFTGEWFIPTPTNSGNNRINITASGLNSTTFTGNYNRWFGIGAVNVKAGDYIKLKWMKVEIERSATQFVPPDTTIELLKCQRYYFALIGDETSISNSAVGIAANNTWLPIGFLFPTDMREIPTISISYLAKWNAETTNENTICNSAYTSKNGIPVLSSSNHEFVAGELYYVRFSADAEIY